MSAQRQSGMVRITVMAVARALPARIAGAWTRLAKPADASGLPPRVQALIRAQEAESERLIGWVQLSLAVTFAALYVIAPRPADSHMTMFAPVPVALAAYTIFTLARLRLSYRRPLPGWLLVLSILADTGLLLGLIWSFHLQYRQPVSFSLKVPTFIYVFVFIALRALRFDHRYVLASGAFAALGWGLLVLIALAAAQEGDVTRNFVAYITSNKILIGAEFDKISTVVMVTVLLTIAVRRAQLVLISAVRAETAGREIAKFLSSGVADVIANAHDIIEAGHAAERDAAILMLDVRGFTRFSMCVPPQQVVHMLTSLHARIVPLVRKHGGVVDKFLGDGVMATFGAIQPSATPAADALRALEDIMAEARLWRETLTSSGAGAGPESALEVNGAAVAGHVLFAALGNGDRLEYTVIGDAVNLAAKLEKHNKVEKTRALVPAATYDLAQAQGYVSEPSPARRSGAQVAGVSELLDLVVIAA